MEVRESVRVTTWEIVRLPPFQFLVKSDTHQNLFMSTPHLFVMESFFYIYDTISVVRNARFEKNPKCPRVTVEYHPRK